MNFTLFVIVFLSVSAFAHEIQLVTQHLKLQRQNETGLQHDVIGKITTSRKWDIGLQGTYLERYSFYEKRGGLLAVYHPNQVLTLEGSLLLGNGNEILPEQQYYLSAYYALADGLTPALTYKDSRYSVTRLHQLNFNWEIEKFTNIILIPQVMMGKSTFPSPSQTRDIHNFGIKAIYYREKLYSFFVFGYKGTEGSQGIIGRSNSILDTFSGGVGASYHFVPQLKTELIIDHTNYEQLKTQFLTTTLNLVWNFQ